MDALVWQISIVLCIICIVLFAIIKTLRIATQHLGKKRLLIEEEIRQIKAVRKRTSFCFERMEVVDVLFESGYYPVLPDATNIDEYGRLFGAYLHGEQVRIRWRKMPEA